VEGGEGGGFKNPSPVSTMVLLPLIHSRFDVPIIAAGGISDGLSMAGAFARGAEGVQMGTRMLSCSESPVHDNWKQAVVQAKATDTVFLNQESRPALRALRTERTAALAPLGQFNVMEHMADLPSLYFGGDMEAAIPLSGQVCGRIDAIKSAREIVDETMASFHDIMRDLCKQYAD
jgi:enoyl-[acyl-carrier protein] reductase II